MKSAGNELFRKGKLEIARLGSAALNKGDHFLDWIYFTNSVKNYKIDYNERLEQKIPTRKFP